MKKALVLVITLMVIGTFTFAAEWPENQFTRLVTKPDFTIDSVDTTIYMGEGYCDITFTNVSVEQLKAYAQNLISDGFRYHIEENTDMTGRYTFRAGNVEKGDGLMVTLQPNVFGGGIKFQITSTTFD